jgi:hypothetical protein
MGPDFVVITVYDRNLERERFLRLFLKEMRGDKRVIYFTPGVWGISLKHFCWTYMVLEKFKLS